MYLCIGKSNLFSLLSQSDFLYFSFKGLLRTFCLLLSEITFLFFQKLDDISPGRTVCDSELYTSSKNLSDIATVTKGRGLKQAQFTNGGVTYGKKVQIDSQTCSRFSGKVGHEAKDR